MDKATPPPAPAWVRLASRLIRRLPAGRYRAINRICRRPPSAFLMQMPEDLGGYSFTCDLRDTISREVCFTGRYEPQETALVRAILLPGMSFVDVGGNWGYYTLLAAYLVGKRGRVVSLEPDPRLYAVLRENVVRNKLDQVTVLEVAAASGAGQLTLAGFDETCDNFGRSRVVNNSGARGRFFQVRSDSLDHILDEHKLDSIDLMKIDIEGSEGFALTGLANSLLNLRVKRLLLELHPSQLAEHGQSAGEVIKQLHDVHYCAWTIDFSRAVSRRAAYSKRLDAGALLRRLDTRAPLDVWPHLLWVMPGLEPLS